MVQFSKQFDSMEKCTIHSNNKMTIANNTESMAMKNLAILKFNDTFEFGNKKSQHQLIIKRDNPEKNVSKGGQV